MAPWCRQWSFFCVPRVSYCACKAISQNCVFFAFWIILCVVNSAEESRIGSRGEGVLCRKDFTISRLHSIIPCRFASSACKSSSIVKMLNYIVLALILSSHKKRERFCGGKFTFICNYGVCLKSLFVPLKRLCSRFWQRTLNVGAFDRTHRNQSSAKTQPTNNNI